MLIGIKKNALKSLKSKYSLFLSKIYRQNYLFRTGAAPWILPDFKGRELNNSFYCIFLTQKHHSILAKDDLGHICFYL